MKKFLVTAIAMALLVVPCAAGEVGGEPDDDSLKELHEVYIAHKEGMAILTEMGIAIGESAPEIAKVPFSDSNCTALVFFHESSLDEMTPRLNSVFELLREWTEIPGLQVGVLFSLVRDIRILTSIQETAPLATVVDDRWNLLREAYNLLESPGPGIAFFFVDSGGIVSYRWLGMPVFGEAWDDFLETPYVLSSLSDIPTDSIFHNSPRSTTGKAASQFGFTDLEGNSFMLPENGNPTFLYFMTATPGVGRTDTSMLVSHLAHQFGSSIDFYAVVPSITPEGLLSCTLVEKRGIIERAVSQEAQGMYGPLPESLPEIQEWLDNVWNESTLPFLLEAQDTLGVTVLNDEGSRALFTWGLSLFGYRTLVLLDANGRITLIDQIDVSYEPLYSYWLEEVIAGN